MKVYTASFEYGWETLACTESLRLIFISTTQHEDSLKTHTIMYTARKALSLKDNLDFDDLCKDIPEVGYKVMLKAVVTGTMTQRTKPYAPVAKNCPRSTNDAQSHTMFKSEAFLESQALITTFIVRTVSLASIEETSSTKIQTVEMTRGERLILYGATMGIVIYPLGLVNGDLVCGR